LGSHGGSSRGSGSGASRAGDIVIQRGGTSFYFPLVTCIVISIVLSGILWLFNREAERIARQAR
jgi:hypothetical protein